MVEGLERFRDFFAEFSDQYVLIGGVACSLALESAGREFRVTTDLDIVLSAEAQSPEFLRAFWEFVRTGDYAMSAAKIIAVDWAIPEQLLRGFPKKSPQRA